MAELTTYRQAVSEGIAREMRRDASVVCLGEDIGAAEGVFKTTTGLFAEFDEIVTLWECLDNFRREIHPHQIAPPMTRGSKFLR